MAEGGLKKHLARASRPLRDALRDVLLPEPGPGDEHWQRLVLNREVDRHLGSLQPAQRSAVEISGDAHASRPWKRYVPLHYPDFDLCAPLEGDERFDVVICEQVIEHVPDPRAAARNLRGLCAPGGHVIVSTPFLVRIHELPGLGLHDYWRFSPRGLRALLEDAGLSVETVGSWGNRRAVGGNFDRWPAYRRWQPLGNEPNLPVQVWAFARNPAAT